MPLITPENRPGIITSFEQELVHNLEVDLPIGSERFRLGSYSRQPITFDGVTRVNNGIFFYDLVEEHEAIADQRSRIHLIEDEIAARKFFLEVCDPNIVTNDPNLPILKQIPPAQFSFGAHTRPEFERNGLGSLLFSLTELMVPRILESHKNLVQGLPIVARVVDNSVTGWTSRKAVEFGYHYLGIEEDMRIWEKYLEIG